MNPEDFDIGVLQTISPKTYTFFWIFATIGLVSIVFARINNASYIGGLWQYSKNYSSRLFSVNSLSTSFLLLNYLFALTLYIYLVAELANLYTNRSQWAILSTILMGVTVFHLIKSTAQFLIANWFLRKDLFDIRNAFQKYQIIGLILLPITLFSVYQSTGIKLIMAYAGGVVLCAGMAIYFYNCLQVAVKLKISYFYIFLYLCTLEILPLVLLAKYLLS